MITPDPLPTVAPDAINPERLLHSYETYLGQLGYVKDKQKRVRLRAAKAFLRRFAHLIQWLEVPLAERLTWQRSARSFVNYLIFTHALPAPIDWLLTARPRLGPAPRRLLERETLQRFMAVGRRLKYAQRVLERAFNVLVYLMAFSGKTYPQLRAEDLDAFERALRAYKPPQGHKISLRNFTSVLLCLRIVLFHDGLLPSPPLGARSSRTREQLWSAIPSPQIRHTVWRYLDQLALMRRPATVIGYEGTLRFFFSWLGRAYPEVDQVSAIARTHIEAFKTYVRTALGCTGKPYHLRTYQSRLGVLRTFFQQLTAWGWQEAPTKMLIFEGDFPPPEEPLPRFLDDSQAAALLRAAQASTDLFTRVCVETLLRTGLRKGEFLDLTVDSVLKIGSALWLRVPLGKMHNDRYIPLHPEVKRLLDEWMTHRGDQSWTPYLFVEYGRRIGISQVARAVQRAAQAAGIQEKVSPHRLRHTLATQAINKGMSLQSIAALLGHRSLSMTLVYARIANRVVQEEYLAVSEQLDRLYSSQTVHLPKQAEGPEMRKLRREMEWRMLGNGYCTRDAKLACEYETICESCPCFVTTPEFLPTLQKQLADAHQKGQVGRAKIYAQLIDRVVA